MKKSQIDPEMACKDENVIACLRDVSVAYGEYLAIYRINIDISHGEFIGIAGQNGSGKSTLLKTIIGLVKPLEGLLTLYGTQIKGKIPKEIKHKIGYVPQFTNFDKNFPARVEDVTLMGRYGPIGIFRKPSRKDHEAVDKALKMVNMQDMRYRPIGHLSGGQQQKVMIAQALATEPDIILLDEPTASLDFKMTQDVMEVLKRLNTDFGITVVTINHNMRLLKEFTSRVIVLNRYMIYNGSPTKLKFDEAITKAFYS